MTIFWFRNDLRLSDNPGLFQAAARGKVLPLYIFEEEASEPFKMGGASRWWLHSSLQKLNQSLQGKLHIYQGRAEDVFEKLLDRHHIKAVHWSQCYEPSAYQQEEHVKTFLSQKKISFQVFHSSLLWKPSTVLKKDQTPYQVFTPFYAQALSQSHAIREPLPEPPSISLQSDEGHSHGLDALPLLSKNAWHTKMIPHWNIGEKAAQQQLTDFLEKELCDYQTNRDVPALNATSRLAPHLHFGEISPNQIWHITKKAAAKQFKKDADAFLRELAWRDFSYYQLFHFPEIGWKNFQPKFDKFPWHHRGDEHRSDATMRGYSSFENALAAWHQGKTGFPIVDAGMRELWQTGTMHNRVRMIVASFLTKNLLIDWREGAAWFWDCLVDADLASNSLNWQWVAGCGVDAAPYFRIFNPILQGKKFDPDGIYVRHFLPELKQLPNKFLFTPWEASETILKDAGITLGSTYPHPIVDLQASRERALQAYHTL